MRTALGAPRGRLIRQLLAEAFVLSTLGAAAGLVVTLLWIASIPAWAPPAWAPIGVNRLLEITPDLRLLAIIVGLLIIAAAGVGVGPALWATRPNLVAACKGAGLQSASIVRSSALRDALVAAQIAVAVVLLVGAVLLQTRLLRLISRDLHFDPSRLITFDYRLLPGEYMKPIGSHAGFPYYELTRSPAPIFQQALDRIRAIPGVQSAAAISHPVLHTIIVPRVIVLIEGRAAPRDEVERAAVTSAHFVVTPGLFATLRTPFVSGRDVDDRDIGPAQWVAIVNEAAARQFWPGQDPIGRRLTLDVVPEERVREVVGVVRDIPLRRAATEAEPIVYTSYAQQPSRYRGPFGNMLGQMTFVVRGGGDLMAISGTVQRALAAFDPDRPAANLASIEQEMDRGLLTRRLYVVVIGFFAAAATLLAAIGTYGVVAYTVGQRSREIGIRRALGASVAGVVALVGQRAIRLIVAGIAAGVAAAMAFTQVLRVQLFGVTPQDPVTYAGACVLLLLVGLAACVLPLRRALAIDPTTALREP
jgi:putative ABC transport system permease protein